MAAGTLIHLPYAGGVWDQPGILLDLMDIARRVWFVFWYKPHNEQEWTLEDAEFMAWVDEGVADGSD